MYEYEIVLCNSRHWVDPDWFRISHGIHKIHQWIEAKQSTRKKKKKTKKKTRTKNYIINNLC